jgi:8-oxo-dGTP diphosphatase
VVYTSDYPFVYLTADVVALSMREETGLSVLLVKRGGQPFKGRWAFPGGFVDDREDVEKAARRELREETGVSTRGVALHQLGAYTSPRRDPRHRVVSVPFLALLPDGVAATAGDDAADVAWLAVEDARGSRRLAFDHGKILDDALLWLQDSIERTTLATAFLAPEFTISELREVYEAVWGRHLDPGNFQRKVTGAPGFLEETGSRRIGGRGRPAALYRAGDATQIWPPMSRERDR